MVSGMWDAKVGVYEVATESSSKCGKVVCNAISLAKYHILGLLQIFLPRKLHSLVNVWDSLNVREFNTVLGRNVVDAFINHQSDIIIHTPDSIFSVPRTNIMCSAPYDKEWCLLDVVRIYDCLPFSAKKINKLQCCDYFQYPLSVRKGHTINFCPINTLRPRQNERHFPDNIFKLTMLIFIKLTIFPHCSR